MQFTFPSAKSVEVSFNVGITGTSSNPSAVSVVLEKDGTALSYAASKDGDEWKATIDKPGTVFGLGAVKLSINVVLNNRLFVPIKATADIFEDNSEEVLPTEQPEVTPTEVHAEPETEVEVAPEEIKPQEVEVTPEELPLVPAPAPIKKITVQDINNLLLLGPRPTQTQESKPVKLQLLKTIEPSVVKVVDNAVKESKAVSVKTSNFRLKKIKTVIM